MPPRKDFIERDDIRNMHIMRLRLVDKPCGGLTNRSVVVSTAFIMRPCHDVVNSRGARPRLRCQPCPLLLEHLSTPHTIITWQVELLTCNYTCNIHTPACRYRPSTCKCKVGRPAQTGRPSRPSTVTKDPHEPSHMQTFRVRCCYTQTESSPWRQLRTCESAYGNLVCFGSIVYRSKPRGSWRLSCIINDVHLCPRACLYQWRVRDML